METRGRFTRLAAKLAAGLSIIVEIVLAFLNIQRQATRKENALKVGSAGIRASLYYGADWLIFSFFISTAVLLRHNGVTAFGIFLVLWIMESAVSALTLAIQQKTKWDITLGEAYRNSFEVLYSSSRIVAIFVLIFLLLKFILWDGTDRFVVFLGKEANNFPKRMALLLGVAGAKMALDESNFARLSKCS